MNPYRTSNQTPVWILIGLNFLVFIATTLNGPLGDNLALSLSNLPSTPWAIITSIFVHADFFHILFNMIALYFFGMFLIQMVGTAKFLFVYLAGGIVGNALYLLCANFGIGATPYDYVVGASGAIFALGGTLALLAPNARVYMFFMVPMPLWMGIIIMFVLSFSSYVAWQAHLGGLIFGALAGWYWRRRYMSRRPGW
jgi:uncharacterized protein